MTSLPAGAISTAWPSTTSLVTPGARRTIMRRRVYAPARAADEAKVRRAGRLEAAMQQEGGDRAGQESQIRAQGHPGDVVEVEGRRFVHEDLVAVRDLPGAREARLDGVAGVLPGGVAGDDLGQLGTGPHEAHLAPEDVDQLGELVEAEGPEDATRAGDAGIGPALVPAAAVRAVEGPGPTAAIRAHRAELVDRELRPAIAGPALPEQHAGAGQAHGRGGDEQHRDHQEQQDEGADEVQHPFAVGRVEGCLAPGDAQLDLFDELLADDVGARTGENCDGHPLPLPSLPQGNTVSDNFAALSECSCYG